MNFVFALLFSILHFGLSGWLNCDPKPKMSDLYHRLGLTHTFKGIVKCSDGPLTDDAAVTLWDWDPMEDDLLDRFELKNHKIDESSAHFVVSGTDLDSVIGPPFLELYLRFDHICLKHHTTYGNPALSEAVSPNDIYVVGNGTYTECNLNNGWFDTPRYCRQDLQSCPNRY